MGRSIKNQTCQSNSPHSGGKGPTSFWMQDPDIVFYELALEPGMHFLDLGCGRGDYSIEAARRVGPEGRVTALDISPSSVSHLSEAAMAAGINNIHAMTADITHFIPIQDRSVDVCLLSTVLHIPSVCRSLGTVYKETERILTPRGRFAIIECKKEEWDFGPPKEMKWTMDEVRSSIAHCGFEEIRADEFEYNYCIQFALSEFI